MIKQKIELIIFESELITWLISETPKQFYVDFKANIDKKNSKVNLNQTLKMSID